MAFKKRSYPSKSKSSRRPSGGAKMRTKPANGKARSKYYVGGEMY